MPQRRKKIKARTPAEPIAPAPKPDVRVNPLTPSPGDEYHVVLTRHELYTLIASVGGAIQQIAQRSSDDMQAGIVIQNVCERGLQLAAFLMSHPRPTLH